MKPKYSIGEIVKIKATGEKVKIVNYGGKIQGADAWYTRNTSGNVIWYWERSLKPYRPSRTGKYRNEKGQFVSKETNKCKGCGVDLLAQEQQDHFSYPDSKQRNYQKILYALKDDARSLTKDLEKIRSIIGGSKVSLNDLEKKIDELGRRV